MQGLYHSGGQAALALYSYYCQTLKKTLKTLSTCQPTKVSITAVAKLLQHGVNTNDSRLTEITVRGDQVFNILLKTQF